MATQIIGLNLSDLGQNPINTNSVITDDLSPFSIAFDQTVLPGNGVLVPVTIPGAGTVKDATNVDFMTDGTNTVQMKNVIVTSAGTDQFNIKNYQYAQMEYIISSLMPSMISNAAKSITDDVYSLLTSANFANTVSVGWSESAPTLDKLYKLIETARGTGKFKKDGITVLMPGPTYGAGRAMFDNLNRDITANLDFKIVPVYKAGFTTTWVVDSSCIAVGFGGEVGGGSASEFEFVPASNGKVGYGIHLIHDDKAKQKIIGVVANYGKMITNVNGAARAI